MDDVAPVSLQKRGEVAVITLTSADDLMREGLPLGEIHWDLAEAFTELRSDMSTRVIVVTGARDGAFLVPLRTSDNLESRVAEGRATAESLWKTFTGIIRCHEMMISIEKPIIARVNGDALGFGSSVLFACDLIVARKDARIADTHLGMGERAPYGLPFGVVPGDGGCALVPMHLSPALAKEYLLLAREYRADELHRLGVINYAVEAAELDETVDALIERLLKRPADALGWAKRAVNRHLAAQLNMTLDMAAAYEMVNFQRPGGGYASRTA